MRDILSYCQEKAMQLPQSYRYRHYCVITDKRGRVVGEAGNSYSVTHPIMHAVSQRMGMDRDFVHAEALALIRAKGRGNKLTVVRVGKSGQFLNSRPCPICEFLIAQNTNIVSVEYTTGSGLVEEEEVG